jgi:hypothetical protein
MSLKSVPRAVMTSRTTGFRRLRKSKTDQLLRSLAAPGHQDQLCFPEGGLAIARSACVRASTVARMLVVADVDMDAFEIGQLELPDGALLQNREPRLAFRTEPQRLGDHHGIRARDVVHIAFDCLDAFDLEAEMFKTWRFWIVPDKILHLPGRSVTRPSLRR